MLEINCFSRLSFVSPISRLILRFLHSSKLAVLKIALSWGSQKRDFKSKNMSVLFVACLYTNWDVFYRLQRKIKHMMSFCFIFIWTLFLNALNILKVYKVLLRFRKRLSVFSLVLYSKFLIPLPFSVKKRDQFIGFNHFLAEPVS